MKSSRLFLMLSSTITVILLAQVARADAMWWFNGFGQNQQSPAQQKPTSAALTSSGSSTSPPPVVSRSANVSQAIKVQQLTEQLQKHSQPQETVVEQAPGETIEQTQTQQQVVQQETQGGGISSYSSYGSNLLSIAGIQPSSIASLLNTVGDTGFRYFNIQDQCRNRAACDLGNMLYKKLSFVHNWLIRTSVRTIIDMNNVYAQSWMEGMLGRNCTQVYATCRQSPLEGLMNLAILQHMVL